MSDKPIRVGVNGFGRIGRTVSRIVAERPNLRLVAINDIAEDVANLAYLYNYDSTYGRPDKRAALQPSGGMMIGGEAVRVFQCADVRQAAWSKAGIDVLIDSSGVLDNVRRAPELVRGGAVPKVIVTHSPAEAIDHYWILGVNDEDYDLRRHHVLSSSICDANAIAHPLALIDRQIGIVSGFVTTLHPWLSYQNLVDAPLSSQSNPGHFWKDYSLGRGSVGAIFPKDTTAVRALDPVLPGLSARIQGFSYRIPTAVVASADITLQLAVDTTEDAVRTLLHQLVTSSPYVEANEESLISIDYERSSASVVIDMQWVRLINGRTLKLVLWYDNEWGYSSRVVDMAARVGAERRQGAGT